MIYCLTDMCVNRNGKRYRQSGENDFVDPAAKTSCKLLISRFFVFYTIPLLSHALAIRLACLRMSPPKSIKHSLKDDHDFLAQHPSKGLTATIDLASTDSPLCSGESGTKELVPLHALKPCARANLSA